MSSEEKVTALRVWKLVLRSVIKKKWVLLFDQSTGSCEYERGFLEIFQLSPPPPQLITKLIKC